MKYISILFILISISACCSTQFCDMHPQGFEDAITFSFNIDGINGTGYTLNELDTIYLDKHNKGKINEPRLDRKTVEQVIILGEDNTDYENFDYVITAPRDSFRYEITNIELAGDNYKNKCSECYYNKKKTFLINGIIYDRSGSNEYIILNK